MGYECSICMDSLEVPAPPSRNTNQTGTPAAAAGSAYSEATDAIPAPGRKKGKKSKKDIRNCTDKDIVTTPCGHVFHQMCLANWFKDKTSAVCPACKEPTRQSKVIRLYPAILDNFTLIQPNAPVVDPESDPEKFPTEDESSNEYGSSARASFSSSGNMYNFFESPLNLVVPSNTRDQSQGGAAGPVPMAQSGTMQMRCNQPNCADLRFLHHTLSQEFGNVQKQLADAWDKIAFMKGTEQSLQMEIKNLQRQVAGQPGSGSLIAPSVLAPTLAGSAGGSSAPAVASASGFMPGVFNSWPWHANPGHKRQSEQTGPSTTPPAKKGKKGNDKKGY